MIWFTRLLVFVGAVASFQAVGAVLPEALEGIPLAGVEFYHARAERETGNDVGVTAAVVGSLGGKTNTIHISPDVVRVEFNGSAGLSADEMASAYLKKMSSKGAKLLNRNLDGGVAKYNGLWIFDMPEGSVAPRLALWINGRQADSHFWYVWPAKMAAISADELQRKISETGIVSLYLNFETNKSAIRDVDRSQLEQAATMLKNNAQLKLRIEGHTDNVGTAKKNQALSLARAQSVAAALVLQGVAKDRLVAVGMGDTKPLADNASPDGRAKNRRVELVKR